MSAQSTGRQPLRCAVVGMGKMGVVHAATIRTHPRVHLVAFCDTSQFMTQSLKSFIPDLHFYDDHRRMLHQEELDVVYVTTPTSSHAEIASDCAAEGKHIFVEKPLGTNLKEASAVEEAVGRAKVQSQVGYVCRYAPTFEKAKEILDSTAIGAIKGFGSVKYSSDVQHKAEKSWRFIRKSAAGGGGALNEFACHGIDLLVWFFGEPHSVRARLESWYSSEVEDYVHAVLDYGDFSGWIDSGWSMQDFRRPYNRIEVTGDNGKIIVTDSEVRWLINRAHAGHPAGWFSTNCTELYEPVRIFVGDIMFTRQADAFLDAVDGRGATRSPAAEGLRTQRVLEAIRSEAMK